MSDGWTDPTKPGKRRKRSQKQPTRNNLVNAIAAARERHEEWLAIERRRMVRDFEEWERMTPEERVRFSRPFRLLNYPEHLLHPDTPEGKVALNNRVMVRYWAERVAKFESKLAALEAEK